MPDQPRDQDPAPHERPEEFEPWEEGQRVRRVNEVDLPDTRPMSTDPDELAAEVKVLREEVELLRRRLATAPARIRMLEERLLDAKGQLNGSRKQNARLTETLSAARDQVEALRDEVDRLSTPPQNYATFLAHDPEADTLDISMQGRKVKVTAAEDVDATELRPGQEVLVNDAMNVVSVSTYDDRGEIMSVAELLDDGRALVVGHADEERIVRLSEPLESSQLKAGDSVLVDMRANVALERIPKAEVEQLVLEEVPDVTYDQIGGLEDQVEAIRDAIELPYLHGELFVEHELRPPKGILLYGPPGCGKTMIAKAVANSLAQRVAEKTGRDDVHSYFLNVKGPELLNKYVGETERQIRLIFQRAREKASEGFPVIVFFDEMESLFRTRGSGVSSDVETTVVPQLLAEIDGVESLKDVVVIGASNREDMIDPAILRPGRLDVKIKVERPDNEAAKEIFGIYLHPELPLHPDELTAADDDPDGAVARMVETVVERMYAEEEDTQFLEVTYANGEKQILHFKDFRIEG